MRMANFEHTGEICEPTLKRFFIEKSHEKIVTTLYLPFLGILENKFAEQVEIYLCPIFLELWPTEQNSKADPEKKDKVISLLNHWLLYKRHQRKGHPFFLRFNGFNARSLKAFELSEKREDQTTEYIVDGTY